MKYISTLALFLCFSLQITAQFLTEEFNSFPDGWTAYSEYDFDYVSENGGLIDLFKQSKGDEPLMLATPVWDLDRITKLEVDMYGINLSFVNFTLPQIHLGYLEVENNFSSFVNIHTFPVTNTSIQTEEFYLGSYSGNKNLVFKMTGAPGMIVYLDNVRLYEEDFQNNIPTAVDALTIIPRNDAVNTAMAQWNNPSYEVDGDPLTELLTTDFYNNGNKIYSADNPTIGSLSSIDVEVPKPGIYEFQVACTNSAGTGYYTTSKPIWIGLDVPAAPTDISIVKEGNKANLTWTAPTSGKHGAFFDEVVDSYLVKRSDGQEYVIPGNESSFTDILDIQGTINYTVTPQNTSGDGVSASSNIIYHLEDGLLYFEDFYVDVVERPDEILDYNYKWTNQTSSSAFWNFFYSSSAGTNSGEMAFLWENINSGPQVSRAISPIINTAGLPALAIEFNHSIDFPADPDFALVLETTSDGGMTWNEIERWQENTTLKGHVTKTIGNSDVGSENFQFAISVRGNTSYPNFARYDNFRLYYQPSIDLMALDSDMTDREEPGAIIPVVGVVENGSTELVDGIATCVIRERFGTETLQTYELELEQLEIGEQRTLTFGNWESVEGEYEIVVTVETASDEQPENNTYIHNLDVLQLREKELVLLEEFTGTWCSFCPGAALGIHDLMKEGLPVAAIAYHRNDDYETTTTQKKMDLYGVLGFPTVVFDGGLKVAAGDFNNSVVGLYRPIVNELKTKRVPMAVEFTRSEVIGDRYVAWIDITSPSIINNPNHILRMALIEDGIEEEWQTLDILDLVEKAYTESAVDLSKDGMDRAYFSVPIPDNMVVHNSHVVVWVQSMETNEVFNAAQIPMSTVITSTTNITKAQTNVFPNPVNQSCTIISPKTDRSFKLYTQDGRLAMDGLLSTKETQLDLSKLQKGIYLMQLIEKEGVAIELLKLVKI